jgi:hypothetical protein
MTPDESRSDPRTDRNATPEQAEPETLDLEQWGRPTGWFKAYVEPRAFKLLGVPVPERCFSYSHGEGKDFLDTTTPEGAAGLFIVAMTPLTPIEDLEGSLPRWDERANRFSRVEAASFWGEMLWALDRVMGAGWITSRVQSSYGLKESPIGYASPTASRLRAEFLRRQEEAEDDAKRIGEAEEQREAERLRPKASSAETAGQPEQIKSPADERNAFIREQYPILLKQLGGKDLALSALLEEISARVVAGVNWRVIGHLHIWRIAKGHAG